ncbi:FG-GAP repeat protein [Streptomyces sp. NPDC056462]|uniref:FG-GAP repeat protein n=1 Tax=Streptomyces sp. NPDC056462 TaxID=3345826 RepID=UPI0036C52914
MRTHHPQRLAFATATTAALAGGLAGDLLTDLNRDGKADLLAAANGENVFDGLVSVLKARSRAVRRPA